VVREDQWDGPAGREQPAAIREERPMSEYTLWFDEYDDARDGDRVGGKCASLGTMQAAGLPVPPGFAVTTEAYETLRTHPDLVAHVRGDLAQVDPSDTRRLAVLGADIRAAIEEIPVPAEVEEEVRYAYDQLCTHCGIADVPVAVRSSATAEDQPDASFAGQQDTYLWIRGGDAVVEHVRRCWASIFTDRAIVYRRRMGYDHRVISMAVGIQKMVDPVAAGVAFTLNPQDGDRSQVAIDASWGLGEAVVSGEVNPDNFLVDKVLRTVARRIISSKGVEYRLVDGAVEKVEITDDRRDRPCLTDEQVCAVAAMARRAEKHYGCPQDIEWALDRHLPEGDNIVLLQSRPETVWSRKAVAPLSREPYDPMKSIVSTLTKPLQSQG
jgi:pyruvate,water dikinase